MRYHVFVLHNPTCNSVPLSRTYTTPNMFHIVITEILTLQGELYTDLVGSYCVHPPIDHTVNELNEIIPCPPEGLSNFQNMLHRCRFFFRFKWSWLLTILVSSCNSLAPFSTAGTCKPCPVDRAIDTYYGCVAMSRLGVCGIRKITFTIHYIVISLYDRGFDELNP